VDPNAPKVKKFKACQPTGKVIAFAFLDEGVIPIEFMPWGHNTQCRHVL
jgi:hypothetical protein